MNYDKFTVFNASAGSGKTYTITQVLAEKLAGKDGLRPEQIIATTFTEKAAAELESRIRERLLDEGLFAQAQALPAALIGTVNSVTHSILQTFAIDAGLNPDLSVIDENAQARVFRIATEKTLYDNEVKNAELIERIGYSTGATTYGAHSISWSQEIKKICDLARANDISPDQLAGFAQISYDSIAEALQGDSGNARAIYKKQAKEALDQAKKEFEPNLEAQLKKDRDAAQKSIEKCDEAIELLEFFGDNWEDLRWKDRQADLEKPFQKLVKSPTKIIKDFLSQKSATVTVAQDDGFLADLQQFIELTFEVARQCMVSYATYKEELGLVDFIDQEHQTLKLLRTRDDVRTAVESQYKLLVVDEFQDTSPLQLAIFMQLAELVEEVIWVGDPKQSIYRFRGADPLLMGKALNEISSHHPQGIKQLSFSYRTHQVPLDFSNQVFKRTFSSLFAENEVVLRVPEQLEDTHSGGEVHLWQPRESDEGDTPSTQLVAAGIAAEITENADEDVERAVLVRTNDEVYKVVTALTQLGIPVLGDHFKVSETREGIVLHAALAFALDERDTKALIELVQILHEHPAHTNWLDQLTAAPNKQARLALLRQWAADPTLAGLRSLSAYTGVLSSVDFVRRAIDAIDLVYYISTWSSTSKRFTALDGLVQAATHYEEEAVADQRVPSIQGFLDYLDDYHGAPATRSPRQKNAVYVSTMHKAKGLEWDRVYIAIDKHEEDARFKPVGTWVIPGSTFNLQDALANRVLYFWPESLKNFGDAIRGCLAQHPLQKVRRRAEIEEEQRLYYVALTRSKSRTVLALEGDFETSMPELFFKANSDSDADSRLKIQILPAQPSEEELASADVQHKVVEELALDNLDDAVLDQETLAGYAEGVTPQILLRLDPEEGGERVDIVHKSFSWAEAKVLPQDVSRSARAALEPTHVRAREVAERSFVPARFAASKIKPSAEQIQRASAMLVLGGKFASDAALVLRNEKDRILVGDAVHGFLALPLKTMSSAEQEKIAADIYHRWGLAKLEQKNKEPQEKTLRETLLEAGRNWFKWLDENYPEAEGWQVFTEVPFTWTDADSRSASGWIDTLLMRHVDGKTETVLVDHKTYTGKDPAKHLIDQYVGQMTAYSQVLQAQTGSKPLQILMHLPMRGEVWEMKLG